MHNVNTGYKKAEIGTLISGKVDFKSRSIY